MCKFFKEVFPRLDLGILLPEQKTCPWGYLNYISTNYRIFRKFQVAKLSLLVQCIRNKEKSIFPKAQSRPKKGYFTISNYFCTRICIADFESVAPDEFDRPKIKPRIKEVILQFRFIFA